MNPSRPPRIPAAVGLSIVLALGQALGADAVRAQPALTGETTLVNASGPRAVAAGGASTAFPSQVFDVGLQPATLGDARAFEVGFAREHDRFPLAGSSLWTLGAQIPLQQLDRHLPSVAVLVRRLRANAAAQATVHGVERRLELAYATDVTTLAAGWSWGDPSEERSGSGLSVGGALHVVESGGEVRTTTFDMGFGAGGDTTTVVVAGLDDLLFAGSLGVIGHWSTARGHASTLQLRSGAVLRRAGEESDALSARVRLTNIGRLALERSGFDERTITRPVMASEFAVGAGVRWTAPRWRWMLQGEVAQGVYAGAPESAVWRWGTEVELFDRLSLRGGGVDDLRLRDLVAGIGVEVPLYAKWRLGFDLTFEPERFADAALGRATIWGLRLGGPLPQGGMGPDAEDSIEDLLDAIDEGLDAWPDADLEVSSDSGGTN